MRSAKKKTLLFAAAGALFSLLAVLVVIGGLAGHVTVTDPEGIPAAAEAVLTAVREEDWTALSALVTGDLSLHPEPGPEGSPERQIWDAYRQSLSWQCDQPFGVDGDKVTQTVQLSCLDIAALIGRMQQLLQEQAVSHEDPDTALPAAAQQALREALPTVSQEITLSFRREGGAWKLIPDHALLELLSGFNTP